MATLGSRIARGLYGRLEFDFAQYAGHTFDESYAQNVVATILRSHFGYLDYAIETDKPIPAIQKPRETKASGSPRQVDIVVSKRGSDARIAACVELKWAKNPDLKGILKDLCRLQIIANSANGTAPTSDSLYVECYFILFGGKTNVESLLNRNVIDPRVQTNLPHSSTGHNGQKTSLLPRRHRDGNFDCIDLRSIALPGTSRKTVLTYLKEIYPTAPSEIEIRLEAFCPYISLELIDKVLENYSLADTWMQSEERAAIHKQPGIETDWAVAVWKLKPNNTM